ncbi:MAG TPA: hypothetical protein ENN11_01945 [Methanomicrobia archaeon]|nr:hypothetical protein [Methanomicrobia archaeon]
MGGHSKFGDVLVNYVCSVAKLRVTGLYDGIKVSNHVLMQALNHSKVVSPPRTDKHQKGDFVEALIARAWGPLFSTEDMIDIISSSFQGKDLSTRESFIDAQIEAFSVLLDLIHDSGLDTEQRRL